MKSEKHPLEYKNRVKDEKSKESRENGNEVKPEIDRRKRLWYRLELNSNGQDSDRLE